MATIIDNMVSMKLHTELAEAIYNNDTAALVELIVWQGATPIHVLQAHKIVEFCKEYNFEPTADIIEAYLFGTGEEQLLELLKDFNKSQNE